MTSPPLSETGPSAEAEMEELIATLAPLAREATIAEAEHSRIHREKGGSSLEDAEANAREARADDAWVKATADVDDAALIDYLIRTRSEAKRSAHLEDARAGCDWCARKVDAPEKRDGWSGWWHRGKTKGSQRAFFKCARPEVWDALSLLPK